MQPRKLIAANFKANFTLQETSVWLKRALPKLAHLKEIDIAICPNFIGLSLVSESVKDTNLFVGAQNVSQFTHGKYTGEVTVEMISGLVRYCIVGHSERRRYFNENSHLIAQKVTLLESHKIKPIVCVENADEASELSDLIKSRDLVIAYEPTFAIGTGHPDTPQNAQNAAIRIKQYFGEGTPVLYGGSVTAEDVKPFLSISELAGFLVGGESLNPEDFVRLVSEVID